MLDQTRQTQTQSGLRDSPAGFTLSDYWPALLLGGLYAAAAVVAFLTPWQAGSYIAQTYLQMAAIAVLGFLLYPPMLLADPQFNNLTDTYQSVPLPHVALYGLLLAGFGVIMAVVLVAWWRRSGRFIVRLRVVVLLIMNTGFGVALAVWAYGAAPTPGETCERLLAGEHGVRILTYHDEAENYWFFLTTRDGGQHWTQFMDFPQGRSVEVNCRQMAAYDDSFYWVWEKDYLALTRDGGQSWAYWTPDSDPDFPRHLRDMTIEDVAFASPSGGAMVVRPTGWWVQEFVTVITTDGGRSWQAEAGAGE